MEVRFWAATDVGRTRDHNEDNFLVDKKLNLFIVADGMGGHAAGEVASSVAVREARRVVAEHRELVERFTNEDPTVGRQPILRLLETAIQRACARVFELAQENSERRGMGTTLSLLLVAGRRGFIGHVGDSRIYLTREGEVHQLTEDHSLINELIKRGRLKPGDAFDSPYKNAVTRAVGVYESVEVDTFDFDILPGDNYLLCSDGLSCYLDDEITFDISTAENVKEIPSRFIELANDSGGKDNITAIIVRVVAGEEDEAQVARQDEVSRKLERLRGVAIFRYLSYTGLVKILNLTEARSVEAGANIYEEDERDECLYVLMSGRVRLSQGGRPLTELEPGAYFGEMALVSKAPRTLTATAVGPTKLLVLDRRPVLELLQRDPTLSVKVLWSVVQLMDLRLQRAGRELRGARESIEQVRRSPASLVELPPPDPSLDALTTLSLNATDELTPGFLFSETESASTDPLLRLDVAEGSGGQLDLDERPGLGGGGAKAADEAVRAALRMTSAAERADGARMSGDDDEE